MSNKSKDLFWHYRPLLTETLPYELPVIFSNDRLYYAKCRPGDSLIAPLLEKLFLVNKNLPTIPYSYVIRKDSSRFTTLSLMHPFVQFDFCQFYAEHEGSLLAQCRRSEYSIRYPSAIAAVYVLPAAQDVDPVHKIGQIHVSEGEPELLKLVSYFAYEKYGLLNKFYESREFVRLEKRFPLLRQIDISKCFYSIYTHTVTWAVKDKLFAKKFRNNPSFERRFDELMQRSNHGETNGILVGPEISRIFAEIILQDVDRRVQLDLQARGLLEWQHYSIRRYVDDYSIFSISLENLDIIESVIRVELEKYKLYINDSKVRNYRRPFVSPLSLARAEIRTIVNEVRDALGSEEWKTGGKIPGDQRRRLASLIHDLRLVVKKYDIQFGNISGSVVGDLRSLVQAANRALNASLPGSLENWYLAIRHLLECAIYITAVDLRVRTTYSLCQMVKLIQSIRSAVSAGSTDYFELIDHTVAEELAEIAKNADVQGGGSDRAVNLELCNVLICGAYLLGKSFTNNGQIEGILNSLLRRDLSYFLFITLKFCFLREQGRFGDQLKTLNDKALAMLSSAEAIREQSELFHLFCDFLSSPDVAPKEKLHLFSSLFGGTSSKDAIEALGKRIGFTDWEGLQVEHTLRRRQLRPVYAVA